MRWINKLAFFIPQCRKNSPEVTSDGGRKFVLAYRFFAATGRQKLQIEKDRFAFALDHNIKAIYN
ncbi:hypothetical protein Q0L83_14765, partial [Staphylococcus aureus]|nr:hypothetical protein [Staphylococcus aureus]